GGSEKDIMEIFELLVNSGVAVNPKSKIGYTLLHDAACLCLAGLIEKMVRLGADPESKGKKGITPLFTVEFNEEEIDQDRILYAVKILIKCGASLQTTDDE